LFVGAKVVEISFLRNFNFFFEVGTERPVRGLGCL